MTEPTLRMWSRDLVPKRTTYWDGSPCIVMIDPNDYEYPEDFFGVLTVNLFGSGYVDEDGDVYQFLDVNNWPNIEERLMDVEWAEPTDYDEGSGFVVYPLYRFKGLEEVEKNADNCN